MKKKSIILLTSSIVLLSSYYFFWRHSPSSKGSDDSKAVELTAPHKTHHLTKNPSKSEKSFTSIANRISVRRTMDTNGKCKYLLDSSNSDETGRPDIPEECLGEFANFYRSFTEQCRLDASDAMCDETGMIEKSLVILDQTNKSGLDENTPVAVRTLRLFALSLTGNNNQKIIEEADQILSIDPTLSRVRDLKMIAMFGDAMKDGMTKDKEQEISSEISKIYDDAEANSENAFTTDFLLKMNANENPEQVLARMKQVSTTGFPYYLEAAWYKKSGDAEKMFLSLDEAIQREPENIAYTRAKDVLTHSNDPLKAQGAFNVSLNHGYLN